MSSAPARLIYRLGCILFACIDRFLAIVNMPFAKLTPATRNVIGVVGAGTMLLSAAAMFAKPYLFPEPDPVGDLRRQVRAHPHSDVPQHPSDAAH